MSRQEADRDDLYAEIRALTPRIEVAISLEEPTVTAGCRPATGGWSVYFGADPVYHFDADGRLRRAYVDDLLYRTQGATLARLERHRSPERVELLRTDLDDAQLDVFLTSMRSRLNSVREAVRGGTTSVLRQEPDGGPILELLASAIDQILACDNPLASAIPTRPR